MEHLSMILSISTEKLKNTPEKKPQKSRVGQCWLIEGQMDWNQDNLTNIIKGTLIWP